MPDDKRGVVIAFPAPALFDEHADQLLASRAFEDEVEDGTYDMSKEDGRYIDPETQLAYVWFRIGWNCRRIHDLEESDSWSNSK